MLYKIVEGRKKNDDHTKILLYTSVEARRKNDDFTANMFYKFSLFDLI